MKHQFKQRIIYADTDAEGVVYYANYLKFFERGRMEYLRQAGVSIIKLKEEKGILFAISKVECDYKAPALFDDEVTVETAVDRTTGVTVIFDQKVLRGEQLLVEAKITACAIDAKGFRPIKLPKEFLSH